MAPEPADVPQAALPGLTSPFTTPQQPPLMPPMLAPKQYAWGNDAWPQAHGEHEELAFATPVFRKVAAKLRDDLAQYKATAQHLSAAGRLQASDVGQWAAGQDLHATAQQTYSSVVAVHDAFVAAYEDIIRKIEHSAGLYDAAEDQTVQAIRKLEGLAGGSDPVTPPSGSVSQY